MTDPVGGEQDLVRRLAALEAENQRLRSAAQAAEGELASMKRFLDTTAIAVIHFHRDGTILFINRAGARNMGGPASRFVGRNVLELLPALAEQTRARIAYALDTGEQLVVETLANLSTGERWFRSTYCPVYDGDRPVSVQLVSQDITELKRVEQVLEATEGRLAGVLEHAPHLIGVLDRDGVIRYLNRAPPGYALDQLMGTAAHNHLPPDQVAPYLERLRAVLDTAQPTLLEIDDPFGRTWEVRLAPMLRHDEVHQVLAFILDISEIKAARERERALEVQVQHAQKLESLGVLAGGIAHDFNNLLVGILGNAQLAQRPRTSASRDDCLRDIVQAAQRAADLCRQMLAYAGRGRLALEGVDVSKLSAEIFELVRASLSKRARLVCECPPGLPLIEGDPTQLRQVVMNLVTNASDALGDGDGVITLRAGMAGDEVYVEVQDTGSGMDAETRHRMFDPFFTTKPRGSGLGLSAVLGIVRRHRGEIHVDSELGRGTTVRVTLPAATGCAEASPEPPTPPSTTVGRTVLVVDDEPLVRNVARTVLEDAGHRVLVAADGVEALAVYDRDPEAIDAVVLDVTMPNLDGRQTLAQLHARDPGLPVVLASGFDPSAGERARWGAEAATQFVAKPYQIDALLAALERALASRPRS
jgi:PAS domain S-box-containing protein